MILNFKQKNMCNMYMPKLETGRPKKPPVESTFNTIRAVKITEQAKVALPTAADVANRAAAAKLNQLRNRQPTLRSDDAIAEAANPEEEMNSYQIDFDAVEGIADIVNIDKIMEHITAKNLPYTIENKDLLFSLCPSLSEDQIKFFNCAIRDLDKQDKNINKMDFRERITTLFEHMLLTIKGEHQVKGLKTVGISVFKKFINEMNQLYS
jgi:hypothetical protein